MTSGSAPFLLLALGNDLLGDDGVALIAARTLRAHFSPDAVEIVESGEAGLRLMEIMSGFEKALIIDAVKTCTHPVGQVIEFTRDDFRRIEAPSPHYAGLPEILETAERLDIDFPTEIRVLGLEVENPYDFSETLTPEVASALDTFTDAAKKILLEWTAKP